jgi:hypothetical protein
LFSCWWAFSLEIIHGVVFRRKSSYLVFVGSASFFFSLFYIGGEYLGGEGVERLRQRGNLERQAKRQMGSWGILPAGRGFIPGQVTTLVGVDIHRRSFHPLKM